MHSELIAFCRASFWAYMNGEITQPELAARMDALTVSQGRLY